MSQSLLSTSEIVADCEYHESAPAFIASFAPGWDALACQLLKIETRQEYLEPSNQSYLAYMRGDKERSLRLLHEQGDDDDLYAEITRKHVDFIRIRPVEFPLSQYMEWELESYKVSESKGERIFCCNLKAVDTFMETTAQHDFMVFDCRFAYIYHYDNDGKLVGGWSTDDTEKVVQLISISGFLKAQSHKLAVLER